MAISHGTVVGVYTIPGKAGSEGTSKHVGVLLSIPATETYAQADGIEILLVDDQIEGYLRNGKAITCWGGLSGTPARAITTDAEMNLTEVTMSAATTVHAHVDLADNATEHANAAMTAQTVPFEFIMRYTED